MAGQWIPEPDRAPAPLSALTPEQGVRLWLELMDVSHQLLIAGLRASIGEDGDLQAAYRQWYQQWSREHSRAVRRMAERFQKQHEEDATPSGSEDA